MIYSAAAIDLTIDIAAMPYAGIDDTMPTPCFLSPFFSCFSASRAYAREQQSAKDIYVPPFTYIYTSFVAYMLYLKKKNDDHFSFHRDI